MEPSHYLIFGDLHGRILPAFRLAIAWAREHEIVLDGILQVGDMGYFPDPSRLDKATQRHAERDPLELGAQLIAKPSKEADQIFAEPGAPKTLWCTAGNHEDFEELDRLEHGGAGDRTSFPVDAYLKVRFIRDGSVATLHEGLRVGALWGIDDQAPHARRRIPPRARIRPRSAKELAASEMDVLLTHDSPRDVRIQHVGSEEIDLILHLAKPRFAFFGHYGGTGHRMDVSFGETELYHMGGFEMRGKGGTAEEGCVGLLRCSESDISFEYLDPEWLKTFTRHNWKYR